MNPLAVTIVIAGGGRGSDLNALWWLAGVFALMAVILLVIAPRTRRPLRLRSVATVLLGVGVVCAIVRVVLLLI